MQHGGPQLLALGEELTALAYGQLARVGIERVGGVLVQLLTGFGFDVLAINPKQLDRWRQFSLTSNAKDDRRDARLIADALRMKPEAFRPARGDRLSSAVRSLLSTKADLVGDHTRWHHRLTAALRPVLPSALAVLNPQYVWAREVIMHLTRIKEPSRVRISTLERLMRGVRKLTPGELIERLKADSALVENADWASTAASIRIVALRAG